GKTVQALAMVTSVQSALPSMVVCPKSLMHNWVKEVKKFTPHMKCAVVEGNRTQREEIIARSQKMDLLITSYSLLRNDIDLYEDRVYHYVILDEAQHIKNYKTKVAKSVKKLNAMFKLVLTGTPMENSIRELWSIFDFIMPGYLGTRRHFVDYYEKEIVKEKNEEVLNELNMKIKPFILRRTKEEVLTELPPKIEQISIVPLTDGQKALYQRILSEIRSEIFGLVEKEGFVKSRMHILSALIKLRQVCNHPGMIYPEMAEKEDISAKLDLLREILAESMDGGHRILLFSQFVKMLHIIRDELRKDKIPFEYIDGKTPRRVDIVDRFNENKDIPIILVSLKAGGTGLNITGADVVVHFDPWWNPMVERQATDRAYRMGQTRAVNVYKFITEGTIEEKIIKMQEEKSEMFHSLDFTDTVFMKTMSWEDLKILFE
ncbi:MAG TPA: DEAD/DEAH box helicase, partial [Firmicutes bacterium]|nr:DEAD/DEAH box helicase [Bacillota bacterium]